MANYFGDMYDNVLMGGPDNDVLWGGMGDDELSGGAGDDRLIGGPGADALDGGPGMDIASYTSSTRGVRVDLGTSFSSGGDDAPVRGGDAEGDSLTSIESIWGSNFADLLLGSHAANYLFGNGGNDQIRGGSGHDLIRGGADDDVLGSAESNMTGSDEMGNDTIFGDDGIDWLSGGMGNDILYGGTGDDTLMGGSGDDVLEGGMGADALHGGAGMDIAAYTLSDAPVTVNLSNIGSTTMKVAEGGDAEGDTFAMVANPNADAGGMPAAWSDIEGVRGSMHDDMLIGDDVGMPHEYDSGMTDDTNTADVDESKVQVAAGDGNMLFGNMGDDMLKGMAGMDTLRGGKGDDVLYGGSENDTLMGDMGDDKLKGEGGNDKLTGGPGADVLLGGTLNDSDMFEDMGDSDTADYTGSDAGVRIDLSKVPRGQAAGKAGSIGEGGHAEGDVLHGIENLTGSAHADMLEGDAKRNILMGGDGDDWDDAMTTAMVEGGLFGNAGNDVLSGGDGNDWLSGGAGHDDIWGGDGDDMLMGGADDDRPFVTIDDDTNTPQHTTFTTRATDAPFALDFDFTKMVDGLNTRAGLFGGKGNDTLDGGTGNDYLDGGEGDDVLIFDVADMHRDGGAGNDTLDASDNVGTGGDAAAVTINLGSADVAITNNGEAEAADLVRGIENAIGSGAGDTLTGNMGANMLSGGGGADVIVGGAGNDTIVGGKGDDATLTGGMGADTFVFAIGDGADTITDFSANQGDKIDLSGYGLSEDELATLIASVNAAATDSGGTTAFTLELSATDGLNIEDGGTITVQTTDRFAELEADDFII